MIRQRPKTEKRGSRPGLTLVEMLVTVAVLVIIMTVMVQVFQAATGAVSAVQTIQGLDDKLRLLDGTMRADLMGATARFSPAPNYPSGPFGLDPSQNLGYFEYGENEFADNQGEDSDDYLRFTAKAPPGKPFTGRVYLPPVFGANGIYYATQPITITSQYAEIIYFVRNGNLYRRVLLVVPERQNSLTLQPVTGLTQAQTSVSQATNNQGFLPNGNTFLFTPGYLQPPGAGANPTLNVSWQGVNDLSARPAARGNAGLNGGQTIVLNTLGDLTNRENRFASPRFADDFVVNSTVTAGGQPVVVPDGYSDDSNADNVPDYYPSLYYGLFSGGATNQLVFEPGYGSVPRFGASFNTMAFPYVFPGAYSYPQVVSNDNLGWIHAPSPYANARGTAVAYEGELQQAGIYVTSINHNPLDLGDNLSTPGSPPITSGPVANQGLGQTWWGFPTWRETLSPNWNDPTRQVNDNVNFAAFGQPNGLNLRPASNVPVANDADLLPAMTSLWRVTPQLFTDGYGANTQFFPPGTALWNQLSWEGDLIMTGVRSFDVKAYDNAYAGYVDLGWGDDYRITNPSGGTLPALLTGNGVTALPFLYGNRDYSLTGNNFPPLVGIQGQFWDYINLTFAHEGRMPPLTTDQRLDAQFGFGTYANINYTGNVGDNNSGIVRLRRVWDSWSTEYSHAPANGPISPIVGGNQVNFQAGPPFSPPIYPSYPPPYPAALRGIQIQIRVVDPANQRVKSVTIRQDFTDKL